MVLQDATVCIGNLDHGAEYTLAVREGLRDIDGWTVVPGERVVQVPDRPAQVRFPSGRYVLPAAGRTGFPRTTVNVNEVELSLLRITQGNLVDEVTRGRIGRNLHHYDLKEIAEDLGEQLWQGTLPIENTRNREVVTAVSMDSLIPERKPGVYVLAATVTELRIHSYSGAVQWFVVSDIGLLALRGADRLSVFARSLSSAEPLAGVTLFLQARNEDTLASLTTDVHGRATFAPGLLRGSGGREAVLLRGQSVNGDYTFLPLNRPGFDLSDRGVGGRSAPGPVDAFLYTDRGIYRPGETVRLTALVRDDEGRAITGLPVKLAIVRPDGVTTRDYTVRSDHTGAIPVGYVLSSTAITGAWEFRLRVPALAAAGVPPTLPPGERPGLAVTLGGSGLSLEQLVTLYVALGSDGSGRCAWTPKPRRPSRPSCSTPTPPERWPPSSSTRRCHAA